MSNFYRKKEYQVNLLENWPFAGINWTAALEVNANKSYRGAYKASVQWQCYCY